MDSKARGIGYPQDSAVVVEGATPEALVAAPIIGVLLDIVGLGLFCRLGSQRRSIQFKLEQDRSAQSSLASSRIAPRWCPGSSQFRSRAFLPSAWSLGCYSRFVQRVPAMM
jgi:hypothetical protein